MSDHPEPAQLLADLTDGLRGAAEGGATPVRWPLLAAAEAVDLTSLAVSFAGLGVDNHLDGAAAVVDLLTVALGQSEQDRHLPPAAQNARADARRALNVCRELVTLAREADVTEAVAS